MHTSHRRRIPCLALLAAAVALGPSNLAHAQGADEYVLILLDRSASMGDPAVTGASTPTFWDNAIAAAQNRVQQAKVTWKGEARPTRAYAVWTFLDDTCSKCSPEVCRCPSTQKNIKQIWPTRASDCGGDKGGGYETKTAMCLFDAGKSGDKMYDLLKNKVLGDLAKLRASPHGNTPLAESLCLAIERLYLAPHDKQMILLAETDGGDNSSTTACSGFGSAALSGGVFKKKNEGWGLTRESWQEHFLRRIVRIGRFPPRPNNATANAAQEAAAMKFSRGVLLSGERLPTWLRLQVDLHYAICDPAAPSGAPCGDVDRLADSPPRELAAKTGPKRPSIHAGELTFFKAMSGALPASDVREFVRPQSASLGSKHKIAGDVDDSGCVDEADLQAMTAKELWFARALPPAESALRADLNRDGWVNRKDAAILLSTWGKGCGKSATKRPPMPE